MVKLTQHKRLYGNEGFVRTYEADEPTALLDRARSLLGRFGKNPYKNPGPGFIALMAVDMISEAGKKTLVALKFMPVNHPLAIAGEPVDFNAMLKG